MAAKKKRLGKIRIKSFKRVVLSLSLLIVAIIALPTIRNAVFSVDSKEVDAEPSAVAMVTNDNNNDSTSDDAVDNTSDDTNDNEVNNEISDVASAANASLASRDEAIKEIGEAIVRNKGISVNLINHSKKSGLSEKVRAALEVNGFTVSTGNNKSLKRINSVIIEKKENVSGEEISKLINIKRVRMELDPDSRFDIVIIIGDDYN